MLSKDIQDRLERLCKKSLPLCHRFRCFRTHLQACSISLNHHILGSTTTIMPLVCICIEIVQMILGTLRAGIGRFPGENC